MVDLGTCRKKDLFITNERLQEIDDFQYLRFDFGEDDTIFDFIRELNQDVEKPYVPEPVVEEEEVDNSLERVDEEEKKAKGLFGDLL